MMCVSRKYGISAWQRHWSDDRSGILEHALYDEKSWGLPIIPTAVCFPFWSETTSSVPRFAHTSLVSRRSWVDPRESSDDAQAPRSRLKTGRTPRERILQVEGCFFAHEGDGQGVGEGGLKKRLAVTYSLGNSGQDSREPTGQGQRCAWRETGAGAIPYETRLASGIDGKAQHTKTRYSLTLQSPDEGQIDNRPIHETSGRSKVHKWSLLQGRW